MGASGIFRLITSSWLTNLVKQLWQNEGRPPAFTALDIFRAALHLPVGLFAVWFIYQNGMAGLVFSIGFLVYELAEDLAIKDRSYKDIFGYLVGMAIMGVII